MTDTSARDAAERADPEQTASATSAGAGRGEPIAWAYEYRASDGWQRALWWEKPDQNDGLEAQHYRNIRPLYQAIAHPAVAVPDDVRRLSEAASKGEWYTDSEKCDGSYGSGEDCHEGYLAYSILTDAEMRHGNPGVILESSNSTVGEIHEEWNEDDFTAWDETAKNNTAFIVAAVNFVRDLIRREADKA